jgi:hypothetical protein
MYYAHDVYGGNYRFYGQGEECREVDYQDDPIRKIEKEAYVKWQADIKAGITDTDVSVTSFEYRDGIVLDNSGIYKRPYLETITKFKTLDDLKTNLDNLKLLKSHILNDIKSQEEVLSANLKLSESI